MTKSDPLYLALIIPHYGSLININPSAVYIVLFSVVRTATTKHISFFFNPLPKILFLNSRKWAALKCRQNVRDDATVYKLKKIQLSAIG